MLRILAQKFHHFLAGDAPDRAGKGATSGLIVPPEVRASLQGDSLVFLHVGKGLVYKSNSTGTRIWRGLMDRQAPRAIAEQISKEYGVPPEQVEQHVHAFVADLQDRGLIALRGV